MKKVLPLALLACSPSAVPTTLTVERTPPPPHEQSAVENTGCSADSDCIVTNFVTCCAPCPEAPHTMLAKVYADRQKQCAVIDCESPNDRACDKVENASHFKAVCRAGACEMTK